MSVSVWLSLDLYFCLIFKKSNFSDLDVEGQFINYYTGKKVDTDIGFVGTKLIDPTINCAILVPLWSGWNTWQCKVPPAQPISCACEHPGQMYLQLRGLCPDSSIDRFYVPRNKKRSGAVLLLGLDTTTIEYDADNMVWKLREHSRNITATTNAQLASYVMGSHEWMVQNDIRECNNKVEPRNKVLKRTGCKEDEDTCTGGQCIKECSNIVESYRTVLKLTGCREGEFTCSDGQCVR